MASKIPYPKNDKRSGRTIPVLNLAQKDPRLAAAVAKTVRGRDPVSRDSQGNRRPVVEDASAFQVALQKRARRNADASAIMKLMPDIELSAQILISSILSPKDMTATELIYTAPKNLVSTELGGTLMEAMKKIFEEEYKISGQLADILRESIFEKGSYPIAVIPENAIDEMINGSRRISTESLKDFVDEKGLPRSLGLLGSYKDGGDVQKPGMSFESFLTRAPAEEANQSHLSYFLHERDDVFKSYAAEQYVTVTDNPAVLKFAKLKEKMRGMSVVDAYQTAGLKSALESSAPEVSDFRVEQLIMRGRTGSAERVATVPHQYQLKRKSVGNPLVMKLPTESVIPVHTPGNPKMHLGYFIAIDEEGNPIEHHDGEMMSPGLAQGGNGSVASNLVQKVKNNLVEGEQFNPFNQLHMKTAFRIYSDLIERDLIARIKNGRSAASVKIARNEEVYRLMLSRIMQQRYTQLLYIPVEYMTYIAFHYGDDGIGQSLLDKQAMLNTVRSVLMFSDIVGSVKNSIGRTKVSMTIDKDDPNPAKSIEHAMDEIVRSRTLNIPLGVSQPADIMEFIQRAGYQWDISGHPGLPDTKFEFENTSSSNVKPDSELVDRLRKASIQGFGLSPETVDNGFNTEFATTAVANNILLAKRVIVWQDLFCPQLSDHLRKVASNTESIVEELKEILLKNFDQINLKLEDIEGMEGRSDINEESKKRLIVSHALHLFIHGFSVELPRPSSVTMESQLNELKAYSEMLEEALNAYLTSDVFTQATAGNVAEAQVTVRGLYKGYFLRKWMAEKNIMPELATLMTSEDDPKGVVDNEIVKDITRHLEAVTRMAVRSMIELDANRKAADKDLTKAGVDTEGSPESSNYGGGGGSSYGGGGDDLGGFDAGGDDFGMGDLGGTTTGDSDVGDDSGAGAGEPASDDSSQEEPTGDDAQPPEDESPVA